MAKSNGVNEQHLQMQRSVLPIPDAQFVGLTTYDARDPHTKYPPIRELRPPENAPNVLIILIDDAGFVVAARPLRGCVHVIQGALGHVQFVDARGSRDGH